MAKKINVSEWTKAWETLNKAVEEFGQDKVDAQLSSKWASISEDWNTVIAPTPESTNTETTNTETTEPSTVQSTAQDILDNTKKVEGELASSQEWKEQELIQQQEADQKRVEEQATENELLIKQQELESKKRDEERKIKLEQRESDEINRLRREEDLNKRIAETERKKLEASQEFQRIKNENAIIEAKADIEIQRQQSAWAYQKLWLWFSSGIINQSQQIATNGIAKIAELKAKMNYDEAITWVEMSKINLEMERIWVEYSNLINSTINSYSDKLDDIDANTEKRIQEVNRNLLLNSQQKEDKIASILSWYRKEKNDMERQHIDDMFKIQDRWFAYQKEVENAIQQEKAIAREAMNTSLLTGWWFKKTTEEKIKILRKAWFDSSELQNIEESAKNDKVNGIVSELMPSDYFLKIDDRINIDGRIEEYIKSWYSLDKASRIATEEYLSNDPIYIREKNIRDLKQKVDLRALNSRLNPSGWSSWFKATNIVKWLDWIYYWVDKNNAEARAIAVAKEVNGEIKSMPLYFYNSDSSKDSATNVIKDYLWTDIETPTTKDILNSGWEILTWPWATN